MVEAKSSTGIGGSGVGIAFLLFVILVLLVVGFALMNFPGLLLRSAVAAD